MIKTFYFSLFLLFYSLPGFSWGARGHIIVADIAKSRLSQSIIDSVDFYLDGTSWENASRWMDDASHDQTYEFMKPWHYVNIDKDKTYVATKVPDIINELDFVITAIKNRRKYTREKTGMYVKILLHLMADLHQPLHCGYASDRGGNDLVVEYAGEKSTLHKVWDSGIIHEKNIDDKDCFRLIKTYTPAQITKIKQAGIMEVLTESRGLLPQVYDIKAKANGKYIMASADIIREQLAKAGLRLEACLDMCFSK